MIFINADLVLKASLWGMVHLIPRLFAVISLLVFGSVFSGPALAGGYGFTTGNVNMREGPSTSYRVIVTIPRGQQVYIHGCLEARNWCDVQWRRHRGYVHDRYLSFDIPRYSPRYVTPPPIIFEFETYRDRRYYPRDRHRKRYDRPPHKERKYKRKHNKRRSLRDKRDRRKDFTERKKRRSFRDRTERTKRKRDHSLKKRRKGRKVGQKSEGRKKRKDRRKRRRDD